VTLERNNTLIVHVGYVANVPYLLCYALKALGYKCINYPQIYTKFKIL